MMETKIRPNLVLLLSGKRKCGKDFVSNKLLNRFKTNHKISLQLLTLSAPLKKAYASENNLNYEKLLDSSDYKETYRQKMIEWSDQKRELDPGFFCRLALENLIENLAKSDDTLEKFVIFLVTDMRRKTDLEFFNEKYPNLVKTIRVEASESTRISRNWVFTKGVDDVKSECDLDNFDDFDFIILNNNEREIEDSLSILINYINNKVNSF